MANQITIGRNPQNTIIVDARYNTVSGNHATISRNGNSITLEDHSTNGTYVNGQKVHNASATIRLGDKVTLGHQYALDVDSVIAKLGGGHETQRYDYVPTARVVSEVPPQAPINAPTSPRPSMPDSHMALAIISLVLTFSAVICIIFSIIAIVNASQVEKKWEHGDYCGAEEASKAAKNWAWASIITAFAIGFFIGFMGAL